MRQSQPLQDRGGLFADCDSFEARSCKVVPSSTSFNRLHFSSVLIQSFVHHAGGRGALIARTRWRDSLVEDGSVACGDHLVHEVAGVEHRDAHQPLDDELRLEEILTLLRQPLRGEPTTR